MFVIPLPRSMKLSVKLPLTMYVDNVEAIFTTSNVTMTIWTKHVDNRYKYVNEYFDDGLVKIMF